MANTVDIHRIPLATLGDRCAEETKRYLQKLLHDTQYCFELFRRAFVDENQQAYERICVEYKGMVTKWVKSRLRLPHINENVEECVNGAFASMFNRLAKDNNFAQFPRLERILGYLQSCAHSAAEDENRKSKMRMEEIPEEFGSKIDIESGLLKDEQEAAIRQLVKANLKNEQERIVYEEYFEWGFMPRQIYARHPDQFSNVAEVHRSKQFLLERLKRVFQREWKDNESS